MKAAKMVLKKVCSKVATLALRMAVMMVGCLVEELVGC